MGLLAYLLECLNELEDSRHCRHSAQNSNEQVKMKKKKREKERRVSVASKRSQAVHQRKLDSEEKKSQQERGEGIICEEEEKT